MWEMIVRRLPSGMVIVCTIFTVVIPICFYTVSDLIHKYGDPPWKRP